MITILPPGILLGVLLSLLYAGIFHAWGGSSLRDLIVYLTAAIIGFAFGQAIGMLIELPLPHIGQVYIVEASVFSWLAMIGARELGVGQQKQELNHP